MANTSDGHTGCSGVQLHSINLTKFQTKCQENEEGGEKEKKNNEKIINEVNTKIAGVKLL